MGTGGENDEEGEKDWVLGLPGKEFDGRRCGLGGFHGYPELCEEGVDGGLPVRGEVRRVGFRACCSIGQRFPCSSCIFALERYIVLTYQHPVVPPCILHPVYDTGFDGAELCNGMVSDGDVDDAFL